MDKRYTQLPVHYANSHVKERHHIHVKEKVNSKKYSLNSQKRQNFCYRAYITKTVYTLKCK